MKWNRVYIYFTDNCIIGQQWIDKINKSLSRFESIRCIVYIYTHTQVYETNMTKNIKKNIKTPNILIINQRFEVTDWK